MANWLLRHYALGCFLVCLPHTAVLVGIVVFADKGVIR